MWSKCDYMWLNVCVVEYVIKCDCRMQVCMLACNASCASMHLCIVCMYVVVCLYVTMFICHYVHVSICAWCEDSVNLCTYIHTHAPVVDEQNSILVAGANL